MQLGQSRSAVLMPRMGTQPHALRALAPLGITCRRPLLVMAAKGFGKDKPARKTTTDDDDTSKRQRGRKVKLDPNAGPIPGQDGSVQRLGALEQLMPPAEPVEEDTDFAARLAALKQQGVERKAEIQAAKVAAASPALDNADGTAPQAVFDIKAEDPYANPPPLAQTLMGGANASDISDPKLRDANIGPSQIGLAAGAIVFIAVFLIVAAGDYAPSRRYSSVKPAQAPPDAIEEKILKGKVALYEDRLQVNPNDEEALEALASSYAKLFDFEKAAGLLERLTARQPENTDAWRLLGEASLLAQQGKRAVPAFEKAAALTVAQAGGSPPGIQLLTGLTDAYISNSDYAKAIDYLQGVRQKLKGPTAAAAAAAAPAAVAEPTAAEPAVSTATGSSDASEAPPAAAAPEASTSSATTADAAAPGTLQAPSLTDPAPTASTSTPTPAPSPSPAPKPLDPVSVELLVAKVYSSWRGHDSDALATYDGLIVSQPEDFRGYLAKGVFLKDKGRKADAERMFLQARFYAPASRQALVRSLAEVGPALDLPDNN